MYYFMRTLLISLFILSLFLIIPYAFFSYICYAGLCGGALVAYITTKTYFTPIYGFYIWLYPLIGFLIIYYSKKFNNKFFSVILLCLPLLCSIPIIYIYQQEKLIKTKINAEREKNYQPQPNDFTCSENIFARIKSLSSMIVIKTAKVKYGNSYETAYFTNINELIKYLTLQHINPENCINRDNVSILSAANNF